MSTMSARRGGPASAWAIVLAGGEGMRLRSFARQVLGDSRPKQYLPLTGPSSLLQQTLDRVGLVIPAERTVVVSVHSQARYLDADLAGRPVPHVLLQPANRGTAAGVLLPAHWIRAHDPDATVLVVPSDHYVRDGEAFMGHAAEVLASVARARDRVVLLGVQPTGLDTGYGWIEPGAPLDLTTSGPICEVRRFIEKPGLERAARCFASGWLWNTLVLAATADTLLALGRRALPGLHGRLREMETFVGSRREAWAVARALADVPAADFSGAILDPCPPGLAVSKLPPIVWSDLGTPQRLLGVLRWLPERPAWVARARRVHLLGDDALAG